MKKNLAVYILIALSVAFNFDKVRNAYNYVCGPIRHVKVLNPEIHRPDTIYYYDSEKNKYDSVYFFWCFSIPQTFDVPQDQPEYATWTYNNFFYLSVEVHKHLKQNTSCGCKCRHEK